MYSCFTFLPGFVFHRQRSRNLALNATSTSHINSRTSLFLFVLSETRSAPTLRPLATNIHIKWHKIHELMNAMNIIIFDEVLQFSTK